ncbi:MAG: hypothetical protein KC416_15895, partial [Myxococcales bacterium]|nr:hypothetical protein [Myxococcales bacterium]
VLQETHVAFLPGAAFGRPKVELHARLAYVDFDGAAALAAAGNSTQLDESFLRVHCAPVVEGIEKLCQWLET